MREYEDEIARMRARRDRKRQMETSQNTEEDFEEFWLDTEWNDDLSPDPQSSESDSDDWEEFELDGTEDEPGRPGTGEHAAEESPIQIISFDKLDYTKLGSAQRGDISMKAADSKEPQKGSKNRPSAKSSTAAKNVGAARNDRRLKNGSSGKNKKKRHGSSFVKLAVFLCILAGIYMFLFQKPQKGYWTIAVFGVDSRDGSLEEGAHSDVEMVCSVNLETGEIRLVSVYRDTYLQTDADGNFEKINSAYFDGGHEQAVEALERNLDLQIDDYVTFSWSAVADAISTLGGIDLEITDAEFEYINAFITETVESTGLGSVHLEHAGMNHLDGVQAVAYARLRLMDTDYSRTARQRLVISLAMEKAKQADLKVLTDLVMSVLPQTSTSLGADDILPLAKNVSKYYIGESGGFPFSRGEARVNKRSCVIPLTLESNVVQLHQFLYGVETYEPSSTVKSISSQIAETTGMGDVAQNAPEASVGGSGGGNGQSVAEEQTQAPQPSEDATEPLPEESSTDETQESSSESSAEIEDPQENGTETSNEGTDESGADTEENGGAAGPGGSMDPDSGGPGDIGDSESTSNDSAGPGEQPGGPGSQLPGNSDSSESSGAHIGRPNLPEQPEIGPGMDSDAA